ncbi:hypothetical protein B7492_28590 [Bacillus mycoides]|uniref:Uncharacterized protein n=1 Tax=Bacillus mycoides TaxID=1405 RepID=A0A1W6AG79_BACMY|nr:hypothetical protein B7492_28590 [Bacillus mycoides]
MARSESRSLQALDQEALFASTERAKWPEILAAGDGTRYTLKRKRLAQNRRVLQALNPNMISILKKQIFPYITLSNIPLKT